MLDDENWTMADETAASLISSKVLMHALLTTLQERGMLSSADINAVFDNAASALELAEADSPRLLGRARQILDRTSRNLARVGAS